MIRLAVPVAVLAFALAACTPPEATTTATAADAPPAPAPAPEAPATSPTARVDRDASHALKECDHAAELFDDMAKRKAAGGTEREALDDLSARGDYSLGYVVDGVFGTRYGPGGSAMARADTLVACRRMAKGGDLY